MRCDVCGFSNKFGLRETASSSYMHDFSESSFQKAERTERSAPEAVRRESTPTVLDSATRPDVVCRAARRLR